MEESRMKESMTLKTNRVSFVKTHLNRKIAGFIVLLVVFLYIVAIIPTKIAYADQSQTRVKAYKSIEIVNGDSLWSIATEHYTKDWNSIPDYIELIKNCNSLYEDEITAGCYLVIPYYTTTSIATP
jgi:cell division protein YceG involved in septum cleavage